MVRLSSGDLQVFLDIAYSIGAEMPEILRDSVETKDPLGTQVETKVFRGGYVNPQDLEDWASPRMSRRSRSTARWRSMCSRVIAG